jgi:hypothetical protein
MRARLLLALLLICTGFWLPRAHAASPCPVTTYPYTLTNGTTADANQVMANFNLALNCLNNYVAGSGANSNITSLTGLTTPVPPALGGSVLFAGGTSTGSANAQAVATTTPSGFALTAGYHVSFLAGFTNTGAVTLAVNSTTATTILNAAQGDIIAGQTYEVVYDGTGYELLARPVPATGYTWRNRLRNGDMRIAGRGASVSPTASGYTLDGWQTTISGTGRATYAQVASSRGGGLQALKVSVTTADSSPGAGDLNMLNQPIEATFLQDTLFGTATAKQLVLSGIATSSANCTCAVAMQNYAQNRSYVTTLALSAGVATPFAIIIPGDTAGTWVAGTTAGAAYIQFGLNAGTTYQTATLNAWGAGNVVSTSAATNVFSSTSNTFTVEDLQLELGPYATPFERRLYPIEVAINQRYFQGAQPFNLVGYTGGAANVIYSPVSWPTMRANPSFTFSTGPSYTNASGATIAVQSPSNGYALLTGSSAAQADALNGIYYLSSEL